MTQPSSATPASGAASSGSADVGSPGPAATDAAHPTGEDPPSPPADPLPSPSAGLSVELGLEAPDAVPPLQGWLEPQLTRIAALAGVHEGQIAVTVVGDAAMADLHDRYKGVPGTTDVLTFDLRDDPAAPLEVDIVVCLDEAARQAAERGHETRVEALLYAVHGLLHLLGEDDADEAAAQRMHQREDELLTAAGFGPVFASQRR